MYLGDSRVIAGFEVPNFPVVDVPAHEAVCRTGQEPTTCSGPSNVVDFAEIRIKTKQLRWIDPVVRGQHGVADVPQSNVPIVRSA